MPAERPASLQLPRALGSKDAAALICLVVAGVAYFSLYYDHGFSLADEGSVVLISARLLEGERPFIDVVLGYGLLWFYPIVLLFKITGVDFIAVRVYFLSLAMIASVLAFLTIRRHVSSRGLAAVVALAILAVPGTLHKSYIPLIVIANMLCLPRLGERARIPGRHEVFGAGLVAAVSFYIRPDLGFCAALVLIAMLMIHTISQTRRWSLRLQQLGRMSVSLGGAALVTTLPLVLIAWSQGFWEPFLDHLTIPFDILSRALGLVETASSAANVPADAGKTLARPPLAAVWSGEPRWSLAVLAYLPLISFMIIVAIALSLMVRRRLQSRSVVEDQTVGILALLGLAYSAFPQFFIFRPDISHLSQFMPGYMVVVGVCLGRWIFPERAVVQEDSSTKVPRRLGRAVLASLFIFNVGLYSWVGLRHQGAGSIALARGRAQSFVGANGVDVVLRPHEARVFTSMIRIIEENTGENEAVLCFPYCPGVNVMANRRTFARRLYVDDSFLILVPGWQQQMIERMKSEQPAMVVVQGFALNGTEISRFQNWATEVMEHIESEYLVVERIGNVRFYVRRDRSI